MFFTCTQQIDAYGTRCRRACYGLEKHCYWHSVAYRLPGAGKNTARFFGLLMMYLGIAFIVSALQATWHLIRSFDSMLLVRCVQMLALGAAIWGAGMLLRGSRQVFCSKALVCGGCVFFVSTIFLGVYGIINPHQFALALANSGLVTKGGQQGAFLYAIGFLCFSLLLADSFLAVAFGVYVPPVVIWLGVAASVGTMLGRYIYGAASISEVLYTAGWLGGVGVFSQWSKIRDWMR